MTSRPLKLIVFARAAHEITEQAAYYRERANVALAERWRTAVRNSIRPLRHFPESGSFFETQMPALTGMRRLRIEGFPNHLIFYEFDAPANTVWIVSVLHGARDLETLLQVRQ